MIAGLNPVVPGARVCDYILELCGGGATGPAPGECLRGMSGTGDVSKIPTHPIG